MTLAQLCAERFTPPGLGFDAARHEYTLRGQRLLSVTRGLRIAGFIDTAFYSDADRSRGAYVHAAIESGSALTDLPPEIVPYVVGYQTFLAESAFRVDAIEERLADPLLACAGTLDLRGQFVEVGQPVPYIDIVDVKTGEVPPWVGYQTAAYVRLLPRELRPRCRRWCLQLRADATYRLIPLTKRSDESVFLAALTVAHAKQGWL